MTRKPTISELDLSIMAIIDKAEREAGSAPFIKDIASQLSVSASTVHNHIKKMTCMGLITKDDLHGLRVTQRCRALYL